VGLVEGDDAADTLRRLLQEQGEGDVEQAAGHICRYAGAAQIDDGELAGLVEWTARPQD